MAIDTRREISMSVAPQKIHSRIDRLKVHRRPAKGRYRSAATTVTTRPSACNERPATAAPEPEVRSVHSGPPIFVPNEPQPLAKHEKDWFYVMKRVCDEHGNVDKGVVREMKRVLGETVFVFQPTYNPLSGLFGLLSLLIVDKRLIPAM